MILIYVDDALVAATDNYLLNQVVSEIVNQFTISSEGPINTFLNINISRPNDQPLVLLSMESYMEQVFKRFNMTPNPSIQTPLNDNLDVLIAEEESCRATIKTFTSIFNIGKNWDLFYTT